jgi:hypothetical protein
VAEASCRRPRLPPSPWLRADDFSSNRHPALAICFAHDLFPKTGFHFSGSCFICFAHDLFRKPGSTFRDHALFVLRMIFPKTGFHFSGSWFDSRMALAPARCHATRDPAAARSRTV